MALVIPEDNASIALEISAPGTGGNQFVTFGVFKPSASTWADALTNLASIVTGFWAAFGDDDYSMVAVHVVEGAAAPPYLSYVLPGPGAGGNTVDAEPPASCVNVAKRTGTPGRRGRGRFFWPGLVAQGDVDESGMITDPRLSDLQEGFDDMLAAITAGPDLISMVVLHEQGAGVPPPSDVLQLVINPQLTWLRSRQR